MKKTLLAAALVVAASAGSAFAGGSPGSIGVGAEYLLSGGLLPSQGGAIAGGPSLNYDAGQFHVGGFLAIADGGGSNDTDIGIGGRFFYHVASSAMADFSVGGSLGYLSFDTHVPMGGSRTNFVFIEPGAQIRAFIVPNVALSATIGLTIGAGDAQGLALTGQTVTGGIHYYFF
ncbi:MAG TPA: hypothetical protein VGM90_05380 [Kofleriaceae bacterium]|jgi:hypothetical protein